jgi:tripartite-type tricarboxylate transporter receptor subunit TctC
MKRATVLKSGLKSIYFTIFLCLLFLIVGTPSVVRSQDYPTKPITMNIGMAPGGVTDIAMRAISEEAKKYLKQEIIPVNKPGASQTVAMGTVISSPADGYTLGGTTDAPYIRGPHLLTLTFDPFVETVPIALFGKFHNVVIVRSDSPFKTFGDFIEFAQKNPGRLTYGTAGVGTMPFLGMEGMALSKKFKVSQVPHTGDQPAVLAVLGGHIMAGGVGIDACVPQVKAGKIRMLALIEGKERLAAFPDLPTLHEFGFENAFASPGLLVFGRKGLADEKLKLLERTFIRASESDAFRKFAQTNFIFPGDKDATGQKLFDYLKAENVKTGSLMKEIGMKKGK